MEIATATASNPVANNAVTNAANLAVISNESHSRPRLDTGFYDTLAQMALSHKRTRKPMNKAA